LEFSVASEVVFESLDTIPASIARDFLLENSENKIGFWCIAPSPSKTHYTANRMYTVELKLLNSTYFKAIIKALTMQCERFNQSLQVPENINMVTELNEKV